MLGQGAYQPSFRTAVPRYGHRVIAVNKKEALAAKVIAKPDTYKTTQSFSLQIITPVCPKGYTTVSEQLYWSWNNGAEQRKRFNEGTVQCIRDEYMISAGVARNKYGYTGEALVLFHYMAGGRLS